MNTVTVTGIGTSRVAPDTAVVRLAVLGRGAGVAESYASMAAGAGTVVDVARRHTDERRVASSGISVWPSHDREGRPSGYEARHSYAVGCADLATAGELLGELAAEVGDALVVDSVGLEVTEDHGAGGKAREAAFADARERAAQLARMAGAAGLGTVQSIVEGDGGGSGPSPMPKLARAAASDGGLQPGETTVTATVTVVWELLH